MTATSLYLNTFLVPFAPYLARGDVTDIYVNRPQELWLEFANGRIVREDVPALDEATLWGLARQIAANSAQGVSREHPLLSATLPDGARVQICAPPATRGPLALAIRKHVIADLTLEDYASTEAFADTRTAQSTPHADEELEAVLKSGDILGFLRRAMAVRKNIIIAGGTSSGKTTFLNTLLKEVDPAERIILIEDTPEIQLDQPNSVGLVAVRGALGEACVTAEDLLQATLRMRPDRIIMGELRGRETLSFLRAVNTGHPGSITTVHADSPAGALEQIAMMVMQAGTQLSRADVIDYTRNIVPVFVQLGRRDGRRTVTDVVFRYP